jgi:hypothetical protein
MTHGRSRMIFPVFSRLAKLVGAFTPSRHSVGSTNGPHELRTNIAFLLRASVDRAGSLLIAPQGQAVGPLPFVHLGALVALFAWAFWVCFRPSIPYFLDPLDFHWHQAYLDYDLDWKTPAFSFAGNLLYNFGIQVPLNTSLAPLLRTSHAIAPYSHALVSVMVLFTALAALAWQFGGIVRMRPVPRIILAGLTALILTIPFGIDRLLVIIPHHILTVQFVNGHWWLEAAILSMTSVLIFLRLGQSAAPLANSLMAVGFGVGCYLVLFAFAEGAVFSVPAIFFYALIFLGTSRGRREFIWKCAVLAILALSMVAARIPQFFHNLYSYTFGAYFVELVSVIDRSALLREASVPVDYFDFDRRVAIPFFVSLVTVTVIAIRGEGQMRRFAAGVLFTEAAILALAVINAFAFGYPIRFYYAETFHQPFLIAFFVLGCLFVGSALLVLAAKLSQQLCARTGRVRVLETGARLRMFLVYLIPIALILYYSAKMRIDQPLVSYPAGASPSVQMLKDEIALSPGKPFRGRAIILAGMMAAPGKQWLGGPGSISDVLENHYRSALRNDHYIHLLPSAISVANEYGHWTSPVTFMLLRRFFGREDDPVTDKGFFPLRAFNPRVARMLGIRMIVSNAPTLADAVLVHEERAGAADLRIFRLDGVNLGQYSPTRPSPVATAAQALEQLASGGFDPERDVVVEEQLPAELVAATSVSVVTDYGPTLAVRGASAGRSLVVLPFEYSHCLRLETKDGTRARLLPVNLQQTGLLFERAVDARISYRFGPLDQPHCRRDDIRRADRLKLRDAL